MVAVVCPRCHGPLAVLPSKGPSALTCSNCGQAYPLVDGVPCFATVDDFYEGKWAEPDLSAGSLRNRLVKKERFFINNLPRAGRDILDLGCGGGWRAFANAGHSVGVDVSVGSLRAARTIYDQVVQAELSTLPFGDGSFDLVVSSDVLGHVPCEGKDAVLREIHRVLRPGGRTLHYIEAEGDDPFMRFARQQPELYARHIVAPEGHIGLESAHQAAARFAAVGFKLVAAKPCYRGLTYAGRFVKYFDNEYRRQSALMNAFVGLCKLATGAAPVEAASNVVMSLLIELGDLVLPPTWAGGLLISCEK